MFSSHLSSKFVCVKSQYNSTIQNLKKKLNKCIICLTVLVLTFGNSPVGHSRLPWVRTRSHTNFCTQIFCLFSSKLSARSSIWQHYILDLKPYVVYLPRVSYLGYIYYTWTIQETHSMHSVKHSWRCDRDLYTHQFRQCCFFFTHKYVSHESTLNTIQSVFHHLKWNCGNLFSHSSWVWKLIHIHMAFLIVWVGVMISKQEGSLPW